MACGAMRRCGLYVGLLCASLQATSAADTDIQLAALRNTASLLGTLDLNYELPFVDESPSTLLGGVLGCVGECAAEDSIADAAAVARVCMQEAAGRLQLDAPAAVSNTDDTFRVSLKGGFVRTTGGIDYEDAQSDLVSTQGVPLRGTVSFAPSIISSDAKVDVVVEAIEVTASGSIHALPVTAVVQAEAEVPGTADVAVEASIAVPQYAFACTKEELAGDACKGKHTGYGESALDGWFTATCTLQKDDTAFATASTAVMQRDDIFDIHSGDTRVDGAAEAILSDRPIGSMRSVTRELLSLLRNGADLVDSKVQIISEVQNLTGISFVDVPSFAMKWLDYTHVLGSLFFMKPKPRHLRGGKDLCMPFDATSNDKPYVMRLNITGEDEKMVTVPVTLTTGSGTDVAAILTNSLAGAGAPANTLTVTRAHNRVGQVHLCGSDVTRLQVEWDDDKGAPMAKAFGVAAHRSVDVPRMMRFRTIDELNQGFDALQQLSSTTRRSAEALGVVNDILGTALIDALKPLLPQRDLRREDHDVQFWMDINEPTVARRNDYLLHRDFHFMAQVPLPVPTNNYTQVTFDFGGVLTVLLWRKRHISLELTLTPPDNSDPFFPDRFLDNDIAMRLDAARSDAQCFVKMREVRRAMEKSLDTKLPERICDGKDVDVVGVPASGGRPEHVKLVSIGSTEFLATVFSATATKITGVPPPGHKNFYCHGCTSILTWKTPAR